MGKVFIVGIRKKAGRGKSSGWQTKPNHERRGGEGEQGRSHKPREMTWVKSTRDWHSSNG